MRLCNIDKTNELGKIAEKMYKYIIVFSLASGMAILAIYLTPLKNFNLREPVIRDLLPTIFYQEYIAHSDAYIFVDVRSPESYEAEHAAGSININIFDLVRSFGDSLRRSIEYEYARAYSPTADE